MSKFREGDLIKVDLTSFGKPGECKVIKVDWVEWDTELEQFLYFHSTGPRSSEYFRESEVIVKL